MRKISYILLACGALCGVALSGFNSSLMIKAAKKNRSERTATSRQIRVGQNINNIDVSGVVHITYIQDNRVSGTTFELRSPDAPLSSWNISTSGNTLKVKYADSSNNSKTYISVGANGRDATSPKLYITMRGRELQNVSLAGLSKFATNNYRSSKSLKLEGSGGSDFRFENLSIGGDLSMTLSGICDANFGDISVDNRFSLLLSGGCNCNINSVVADETKYGCSGASKLTLNKQKGNSMALLGSGCANIEIDNLNVKVSSISVSGATTASLSGKSARASMSATGSSKIFANNLVANHNGITVSQSALANIQVKSKYERNITPTSATVNVSNQENLWQETEDPGYGEILEP